MQVNALMMDSSDNVVTGIKEIRAGEDIIYRDGEELHQIKAQQDIPFCHKAAIRDIAKGEMVIKYGETLGEVSEDIRTGCHVADHNICIF